MYRSQAAQVWAKRLEQFDQDSLTIAQFCLRESVSQASFYQWRRKLRGKPSASKQSRRRRKPQFLPVSLSTSRSTSPTPTQPTLITQSTTRTEPTPLQPTAHNAPTPLQPIAINAPTPLQPIAMQARMTVELPGGIRIRFEVPGDPTQPQPTQPQPAQPPSTEICS